MKDLTEVDTFSTPITVPENADSRNDAAGDVERIAQRLANRTHYLNLRAAKTDTANTFTAGQTINPPSAATPLIRSLDQPSDHTGNPTNIWKLIWEAECNDGRRSRFYGGDGSNGDSWILTFNAVWDPAGGAQTWSKDNVLSASSALWCRGEELRWYGRATGAGSWATSGWDATRGDFKVGGTATIPSLAGNVSVSGNVNCADITAQDIASSGSITISGGGNLTVGNDVSAGGDVSAAGEYEYAAPVSRSTIIPIWSGFGEGVLVKLPGLPNEVQINAGEVHMWPVTLPTGAVVNSVDVLVNKQDASMMTVRHWVRSYNWVAPSANDVEGPSSPETSTAVGLHLIPIDLDTADIDNSAVDGSPSVEHVISVVGAASGDSVRGLRVHWTDPGPRNH